MQIHPLITDSKSLAELCGRLSKSEFVAVDTEFMREQTYWPALCLVQIADAVVRRNEQGVVEHRSLQVDTAAKNAKAGVGPGTERRTGARRTGTDKRVDGHDRSAGQDGRAERRRTE